jgi:lipoprotein-releasing system permease protein
MWNSITWSLAGRNLRYGLGQSLLTMAVVAMSVVLIVFIGSLISGLQIRLTDNVVGAIAHVVVKQPERAPAAPGAGTSAAGREILYVAEKVTIEQRTRKIEDWQVWLPRLEDFDPGIIAVSPVVDGQAIVTRGSRRAAVSVQGVVPARHNGVVDVDGQLVAGRFVELNAGEVAMGYRLAEEFALVVGDKVRLLGPEGVSRTYTVAGIFDTGSQVVDGATVFLTLRDAQSFFALGSAVTSIGIKLEEVFDAPSIAARLRSQMPYDVEAWTEKNQSLLSGLRAQSSSSGMIQAFTIIAAGFAIASIMVMAVTSRLREIGVLKAMGATSRQIRGVFSLQGTLLALVGALIGAAAGGAMCAALGAVRIASSATGKLAPIFPMDLSVRTVVVPVFMAVFVGFVASLYPAWRGSRINPIDIIRGQ